MCLVSVAEKGMCDNVAVQRRRRIIVQKRAVGRNPIETQAFVDERKSPSNVGTLLSDVAHSSGGVCRKSKPGQL